MNRLLSKRLEQLEQAATPKLSVDADRLLVSLLGRLDALFWPFRQHAEFRAEVRLLQVEYLAGRGGLRSRSQGESNWKAGHHARNELIKAGLVTPQIEGGQVTSMRLTMQGIADARAMVGYRLRGINDKITQACHEILRRQAGQWIRENDLFGEDVCKGDNPTDWNFATECVLPLLRYGAIESNSDSWKRVYFWFVDSVASITEEPSSLRQMEPWADAEYISAFNSERVALQRLESDGGIHIPVRCT
jgi:hypothetical protein